MPLRLEQLPDRTPVRMNLSVDPDLASALADLRDVEPRNVQEGKLRMLPHGAPGSSDPRKLWQLRQALSQRLGT